jgi:hypothetical protein
MPAIPPGQAAQYVSAQPFPAEAGVNAGAWQSGPVNGTWMSFPGQQTFIIYPTLPDGGPFVGPYLPQDVYVSPDPNPDTTSGSNFVNAAGNIAEFSGLPDGGATGFMVFNDTCSPYYLWLSVLQQYPPDAGASSTPADAGAD